MTRFMTFILENDFTALYGVLVFVGTLLAVAWFILMRDDPANAGLPEWDLRFRRLGIIIQVAGFMLSVLFGGDQKWAPWPTMLIVIFGFDFYLAAAIFTAHRRAALRDKFLLLHQSSDDRFFTAPH